MKIFAISCEFFSPDEVLAVTAEGWMLKKSWSKLVVLDNCHILLLKCSLPGPEHGGVHHPLLLVWLLNGEGHDLLCHCISVPGYTLYSQYCITQSLLICNTLGIYSMVTKMK
jgi:hypothetical protein